METRPLGRTGLDVPILSFGASSLGGVFRQVDPDEAKRAVHVALDGGMSLIDTSPFYGITKSESVLGEVLRDVPRESYTLATKCGRYGMDEFDFSAERVTRSIDESLQRMGVDHVDLFQAHDIEFGDLDFIINETIPAMLKLKEQGKTRFIGITGLPLKIYTYVVGKVPAGVIDTILSYCHYSLNDTSLLDILPAMEEAGVGVLNAGPTSMGLLSTRQPPEWHPASDEVKAVCQKAADFCAAKGEDLVKLGVQYSIAEPRIATTLVGSANPTNIEKNLKWAAEPINEELLAEVLAILEPIHNVTWPSGRPENNDLPCH